MENYNTLCLVISIYKQGFQRLERMLVCFRSLYDTFWCTDVE